MKDLTDLVEEITYLRRHKARLEEELAEINFRIMEILEGAEEYE